jgi:hypothetical protein
MRSIPVSLAAAALTLAASLSGCATTGGGGPRPAGASALEGTRVVAAGSVRAPAAGAVPLRTPARVMRIWIAPWEDSRGDLHAPGYLYTEIDPRRWALEEGDDNRPPVRPLQIERRAAPSSGARSGRDAGATRTPGRTRGPKTGPNLLGS